MTLLLQMTTEPGFEFEFEVALCVSYLPASMLCPFSWGPCLPFYLKTLLGRAWPRHCLLEEPESARNFVSLHLLAVPNVLQYLYSPAWKYSRLECSNSFDSREIVEACTLYPDKASLTTKPLSYNDFWFSLMISRLQSRNGSAGAYGDADVSSSNILASSTALGLYLRSR